MSGTRGLGGEGRLPEPEKGAAAEGVVTPLVGAGHECADQAADDEDDAHEERRDDVRERETGRKQDLEEQQGEVDEPLDIPDILDSKRFVSNHTPWDIGADLPRFAGLGRHHRHGTRRPPVSHRGQMPSRSRQDWRSEE